MDAAVNGGIQNYKKAFLSETFLEEHGELGDLVQGNKLDDLINLF